MNVAQETLGFRRAGLFTRIIATYVSILTSDISSEPHGSPSTTYRTLPYHANELAFAVSVRILSPGISSAQADSTSELLRFL